MKLLAECGIAVPRRFDDGQTRYEPATGRSHHDHLICTGCGRIVEFENEKIEDAPGSRGPQPRLRGGEPQAGALRPLRSLPPWRAPREGRAAVTPAPSAATRPQPLDHKEIVAAPRTLVLVGNPNVGKSVLFGALTGKYVTVSNYPGTTVEVTRGRPRSAGPAGTCSTPRAPTTCSPCPRTSRSRATSCSASRSTCASRCATPRTCAAACSSPASSRRPASRSRWRSTWPTRRPRAASASTATGCRPRWGSTSSPRSPSSEPGCRTSSRGSPRRASRDSGPATTRPSRRRWPRSSRCSRTVASPRRSLGLMLLAGDDSLQPWLASRVSEDALRAHGEGPARPRVPLPGVPSLRGLPSAAPGRRPAARPGGHEGEGLGGQRPGPTHRRLVHRPGEGHPHPPPGAGRRLPLRGRVRRQDRGGLPREHGLLRSRGSLDRGAPALDRPGRAPCRSSWSGRPGCPSGRPTGSSSGSTAWSRWGSPTAWPSCCPSWPPSSWPSACWRTPATCLASP